MARFKKGHKINLGKKFVNRKLPPPFTKKHRENLSKSLIGTKGYWLGKKKSP